MQAQSNSFSIKFCNGNAYLLTSLSGVIQYYSNYDIVFEGGVQEILITPQVITQYNLPFSCPIDIPPEKVSCSTGSFMQQFVVSSVCGPVGWTVGHRYEDAYRRCFNTNSFFCSGTSNNGGHLSNDDC